MGRQSFVSTLRHFELFEVANAGETDAVAASGLAMSVLKLLQAPRREEVNGEPESGYSFVEADHLLPQTNISEIVRLSKSDSTRKLS